jgi:hypothetical protein
MTQKLWKGSVGGSLPRTHRTVRISPNRHTEVLQTWQGVTRDSPSRDEPRPYATPPCALAKQDRHVELADRSQILKCPHWVSA